MGIIYYDTQPTSAQLGDVWWDTSAMPAVARICTNISPIAFALVGQQKTTTARFVPASGDTITIPNCIGDQIIFIAPTADIAALTIAWPSTPYNGQSIRIVATKNIASITHSGASLNRSASFMPAAGDMNFVYDAGAATFMSDGITQSTIVSLPLSATIAGGAGNAVCYLTDSGLVGGNALFASVQSIQVAFDVADPLKAFAKPVLSNGTKTVTIGCKISTQNLVTILGISVIGSTSLGNAADGTVLTLLIHGTLA